MSRSEYGTLPPLRCKCGAFLWRHCLALPGKPLEWGPWICGLGGEPEHGPRSPIHIDGIPDT